MACITRKPFCHTSPTLSLLQSQLLYDDYTSRNGLESVADDNSDQMAETDANAVQCSTANAAITAARASSAEQSVRASERRHEEREQMPTEDLEEIRIAHMTINVYTLEIALLSGRCQMLSLPQMLCRHQDPAPILIHLPASPPHPSPHPCLYPRLYPCPLASHPARK